MLTNLEVFTPGVLQPPLPIVDQSVALDAIQIKKIDGLGPVKANVSLDEYGSIDGGFLTGTQTPERNIVITVGLNPQWANLSIEAIRQILYLYFTPESSVLLRFSSTHMPTVEISGTVESCEPNIFEQNPEYTISIVCALPYFVAIAPTTLTGVTAGSLSDTTQVLVNYQGNVDAGVQVDFTLPNGAAVYNGEVRVSNATPVTNIFIATNVPVDTTQFFRFSSLDGNKFARKYPLPSGNPTNLLAYVAPGSAWVRLRKGPNKLQFLSTAALNWSLSYYPRYGGL